MSQVDQHLTCRNHLYLEHDNHEDPNFQQTYVVGHQCTYSNDYRNENIYKNRRIYETRHIPTNRHKGYPDILTEKRSIVKDFYDDQTFTNFKPLTNMSLPNKARDTFHKDDKIIESQRMDWNNYHRLDVIHAFMDELECDFPSICTCGIIGKSLEGRNLKILKISNSDASNASVWIDAGIHAREWIAPAVATYIADYIARNFNALPDSITNKDWYFLPVINPDGYEFSHTKDRMWRKNRAWHAGQCVGVDLNRNFSLGWGGKESSDVPTNAFYRGPEPFSEPESTAIKEFIENSGISFKVYITLHSYGQVIVFPFAFRDELCSDYIRLLEGATVMSKAIYETSGNTYKVGISRDVMYGAAGTSNDWSYGAAGIPYCYLIELRSKKHKFRLPKEEIEETGNEILSSVKNLMEFVDDYSCNKIECVESNTVNKVDSYGEVIIFPWGYTDDPCPDYVELLEGGTAMAKAIHSTNGHTYKVGSTKDLMYYACGNSIDWSYAVANIPYSYMVELRGKKHRFLLPKEEIISTAVEVMNGILTLMDFVDRRCRSTQSCVCPKCR